MKINIEKIPSGARDTYISKIYNDHNFNSPRHYHEEYELILIEESEGRLFAGNSICSYKKGDLFLFAPNMVHSFKNKKIKNKKARASIILFKKDFLGKDFLFRKETALLRQLLSKADQGIQFTKVPDKLLSILSKAINTGGLQGIIHLLEVLDILSKQSYKILSSTRIKKYYYKLRDDKLSSIFNFVEKNYARQDVYREITELTKMSSPSFSRYFKHKTGKTFIQFLNEIRISKAQKLLLQSSETIEKIASRCGFPNPVYFNRVFKKLNGMTPKKFRSVFSQI